MNQYSSLLTTAYSDRQSAALPLSPLPAAGRELLSVIETLTEGQQLIGEIINRTTTDVTIRLQNGQTLQAHLDVSVPLSIGQTANFEVTHAEPAQISLRVLQEDTVLAQNALTERALAAADLPSTPRNTEIVTSLLKHNLPISKESIQSLIRQSNTYPDTDINTLALLTQHKLPINRAVLTQFEAYRNYEHQILPRLEQLVSLLNEPTVLRHQEFSDSPAPAALKQVLQRLCPADSSAPVPTPVTDTVPASVPTPVDVPVTDAFPAPVDTPAAPTVPAPVIDTAPAPVPSDVRLPEAAPLPDNLVPQLLTRWTLSPKDLTEPDKVKEFYQQLCEDLEELHTTLRSSKDSYPSDSPLERFLSDTASATGRLKDNLEFMNMLNRIFPYLQLPIRFSDKTAHGELYVYTKKEKLRSESGNISVLLHLDMENLGPTDIYLSLTSDRLTSRFYLNDASQKLLFKDHLPELKETLTEKGFQVDFELMSRAQAQDPVREFLNQHDHSGLSRFSFDCRA